MTYLRSSRSDCPCHPWLLPALMGRYARRRRADRLTTLASWPSPPGGDVGGSSSASSPPSLFIASCASVRSTCWYACVITTVLCPIDHPGAAQQPLPFGVIVARVDRSAVAVMPHQAVRVGLPRRGGAVIDQHGAQRCSNRHNTCAGRALGLRQHERAMHNPVHKPRRQIPAALRAVPRPVHAALPACGAGIRRLAAAVHLL